MVLRFHCWQEMLSYIIGLHHFTFPSGSVNVTRTESWYFTNNRQKKKKKKSTQQLIADKCGSTSDLIDKDILAPLEKVITVFKSQRVCVNEILHSLLIEWLMETVCVFIGNVFHCIQLQLLFLLNSKTEIHQLIWLFTFNKYIDLSPTRSTWVVIV